MTWSAMALLGAYHGINPGMGWLFAVALGLQQGRARGVWLALPPIALGHALAVGFVLAAAVAAEAVVPLAVVKIGVASVLVTLGLYRLWRHRHPHFGGMQVGFRDLTVWSFLMASAHGSGVMLLPFVLGMPSETTEAASMHADPMIAVDGAMSSIGILAVGVHTLSYLLVTTLTAWIVYSRVGLSLLRTAWINLDWLWAGALVVTGAVVLFS